MAELTGPGHQRHYREVMTLLGYDRYCDEIVIQTDLLNAWSCAAR